MKLWTALALAGSAMLVAAESLRAAETNTVAEAWHRIEDSGITIEYQDNTAELARQILPEAVKRLKDVRLGGPKQWRKMESERDEVLLFIAHQLGLDRPGRNMTKTFDMYANVEQQIRQGLPDFKYLRIWSKEKLKTLLMAGKEVPGFKYDARRDKVEFMVKAQLSSSQKVVPEPARIPFPIVFNDDPSKTPFEQALEMLDGISENVGRTPLISGGMLLHEVAEVGIVADLKMKSTFRRWFCDGMANVVAALCLEKFIDESASREFLALQDAENYEHLKDHVDLLSWRAAEMDEKSPTPVEGELVQAYYAFATHEMLGLVERHGRDVLSAIFKELAKSETLDSRAALAAIGKVTGEDLSARFQKYGGKATEHFEGLAISHFVIGPYEKDDKGEWHMQKSSDTIPFSTNGTRGVALHFHYETLKPPIELKVELLHPERSDDEPDAGIQVYQLDKPSGVLTVGYSFSSESEPGEYHIRTFFDGDLFKELNFNATPVLSLQSE